MKLDPLRIAIADVSNVGDPWVPEQKLYEINRINVPAKHRGNGYGSKLLQEVIDEADANGVTLRLHVSASDGLSDRQLTAWYKRHGFKSAKGTGYLVRAPHIPN